MDRRKIERGLQITLIRTSGLTLIPKAWRLLVQMMPAVGRIR
jgi:hypothetical protein